jgi:hypothetical protein
MVVMTPRHGSVPATADEPSRGRIINRDEHLELIDAPDTRPFSATHMDIEEKAI